MYAPGRLAKCKGIPLVNPKGREFHKDVDHIELSVEEHTLKISELVREINNFSIRFSAALKQSEHSGKVDANGLIRFELLPND
jgi:hypothetical protein